MVYSPEHNKMFCPHCDGTDSEEKAVSTAKEECINCGAALEIGKYNSTCKCEYCGSYMILDGRVDGTYRPRLILPFKIGKKNVVERMRQEFKSRVFTPDSFLSEATLEEMKGIYVPFWLYDYEAKCDYAGTGTKIRVWVSGDTEYTETSYYHVERNMDIDFSRIPVDASIEMADDKMDLMEPFGYEQLEAFKEEYLSGFYGEIYNMEAGELEKRAEGKAGEAAEVLLGQSVAGYATLMQDRKTIDFRQGGACYALLPVWRYLYKYKDIVYEFYVNGQTGKIVGETPVSRKKVLAYGGTVFGLFWLALFFLLHIVELV